MGFLYLVEEHHRVGFPPDGLGELSALVVADVSRRSADESADGVLLLILAHVDTCHHLLVVEEIVGQRLGQLGLSDTRRTHEDERGDRPFRVLQSGSAPSDGIGHSRDGFVLSYHALVELFL